MVRHSNVDRITENAREICWCIRGNQRAEEKAALATAWEERQAQPPAPLSALVSKPAADLPYAPVQLDGSFLAEQYFLLDNRIQQGQFGYEVLGILQLADGSGSAVVNRGWIAGDASRRTLPRVPPVPLWWRQS